MFSRALVISAENNFETTNPGTKYRRTFLSFLNHTEMHIEITRMFVLNGEVQEDLKMNPMQQKQPF